MKNGEILHNSLKPTLRIMSLALPAWTNDLRPHLCSWSHKNVLAIHHAWSTKSRATNWSIHQTTTIQISEVWCPETPTLNPLRDLLPAEGGMRLHEQLNHAWTMAGYPNWSIGRYRAMPQPLGRYTTPMCRWNVFTGMNIPGNHVLIARDYLSCGERIHTQKYPKLKSNIRNLIFENIQNPLFLIPKWEFISETVKNSRFYQPTWSTQTPHPVGNGTSSARCSKGQADSGTPLRGSTQSSHLLIDPHPKTSEVWRVGKRLEMDG